MQRPILLHVCVVQKADEESREHQQRMQQQSDDAERRPTMNTQRTGSMSWTTTSTADL